MQQISGNQSFTWHYLLRWAPQFANIFWRHIDDPLLFHRSGEYFTNLPTGTHPWMETCHTSGVKLVYSTKWTRGIMTVFLVYMKVVLFCLLRTLDNISYGIKMPKKKLRTVWQLTFLRRLTRRWRRERGMGQTRSWRKRSLGKVIRRRKAKVRKRKVHPAAAALPVQSPRLPLGRIRPPPVLTQRPRGGAFPK